VDDEQQKLTNYIVVDDDRHPADWSQYFEEHAVSASSAPAAGLTPAIPPGAIPECLLFRPDVLGREDGLIA